MHTQIFNELLKLGVETGASDCIIKTNKVRLTCCFRLTNDG